MNEIPYGYCQCGCGKKTTISHLNIKKLGWIKGEPLKYTRGHNSKTGPCQNNSSNSDGYCHCGCGQKTNLCTCNYKKRGYVRGEPKKFILGHTLKKGSGANNPNWKGGQTVTKAGYLCVTSPNHPRADSKGYAFDHILKAEKSLGKFIKLPHVVHHHTPDELVICENQAYHLLLHQRMKAFKASGHTSWRKCRHCKKYDSLDNLIIYNNGHAVHRECMRANGRMKYKKKCESMKNNQIGMQL